MPANTTVRLHYVFGYTPVARAWNRTVDDVIAAASALLAGPAPLAEKVRGLWHAKLHKVGSRKQPNGDNSRAWVYSLFSSRLPWRRHACARLAKQP